MNSEKSQRHNARMARKKAVIDEKIQASDINRGVLLVLTGNGKGKSSSAFGMLARSLGHGMQAGVAQFIKGRDHTGEEVFFRRQPGVQWHLLGEGFTWETQNLVQDIATARRGWEKVREMLQDEDLGLVILDELTYPLKYGWLELESVLADLTARPPMQHVIVTGRGAPEPLIELADTVTEMHDTKHAFRAGVKAQPGVDL
ncbi:MAG: cob(I)yrinic acid a,c-diamide adenosyltransferase [Gammaproteobacteria bacterium]|nr:cob(I)yrinic acid a,c-diamide adenosyltransferase [Gammaproteobacteria bacterium]MCW8958856.1 cob(I)yrinic acid a,c-diamide adenosyltransferase [Gammaproteobacteria bacterium]MCW8971661.1 cob(I)yrinic acid a,c-diamide adenosyltransferase [Gammaproteobacteria bacterium]MCW8993434.1 cob(I)yrinic acid a,c-diamide adenosyltransferase [Gammaproteobacteria bacterium]